MKVIVDEKYIVVAWVGDSPYGDSHTMVVVKSDHPRFTVGQRFDFGFFNVATQEGYTICSIPSPNL